MVCHCAEKVNMKTKDTTFPPREAWDFRDVDDSALERAILYEYARTSDKLRNAIWNCLNAKIKGKRAAEHIKAALIEEQKTGRPRPDCYPDGVRQKIQSGLLEATAGNFKLVSIIMHRPDFPAHWLAFPITYKRNPQSGWPLLISPMNGTEGNAAMAGNDFHLSIISWQGVTIAELVSKFEKWLRAEAKKHPQMKGRGMTGQRPVAPLAWLAAYRINKAGVTYDAAQNKFQGEGINEKHAPVYKDPSGWSDAIKKARQILTKLEAGQF